MKKKEYNVGEEFQVGRCRLKCIEQQNECTGCFFFPFYDCSDIKRNMIGECTPNRREDKKDVIFVKIKEE